MEFKYKPIKEFEDSIDIADIGQCSLEAVNSLGMCSYLIIRTLLGESTIFEYGPIVPDVERLPNEVTCKITKIDFDENKLKKIIQMFIADRGKIKIEQVSELSMEEALNQCRDLIQHMRQFMST